VVAHNPDGERKAMGPRPDEDPSVVTAVALVATASNAAERSSPKRLSHDRAVAIGEGTSTAIASFGWPVPSRFDSYMALSAWATMASA